MRKKIRTSMLTQLQIENAIQHTRSNSAAAEYLRVSYPLYRKFASKYKNKEGVTLFEAHKNQAGKHIQKMGNAGRNCKIEDILEGKHPTYSPNKLKRRLISNAYVVEECAQCGFNQRRPSDLRVPLVLNFIDNDSTNHKLGNMELLCLNCYFILVGTPPRRDLKGDAGKVFATEPEREELIDVTEQMEAVSTIEMLTDEEKQQLLENLRK